MKYFIAFVPEGILKAYQEAIDHNVASQFGIERVTAHCPTHMTFKAPFDATEGQIKELKEKFSLFAEECRSSLSDTTSFSIEGFGHLGRALITLDVFHSRAMESIVTKIQEILLGFPWVTWGKHEPIFHLHVTVSKGIANEFDDIWNYLMGKSNPEFIDLRFDNFAILRFEEKEGIWVVDSIYSLAP